MKFSRFSAFSLGVVMTAVSVGAVSYVDAAGDATIKACANKKSGAMRYITKGKCKKTETALSWNQMGPQGMTGATGAAGTNGDTGSPGTNGQNLFLMNSDGTTVGQVTQASPGSATVLFGGYLWDINTQNGNLSQIMETDAVFRDAGCTITYGISYGSVGIAANSQAIVFSPGSNNKYDPSDKVYRIIGKGLTYSSQTNLYSPAPFGGCTEMSSATKTSRDAQSQTLFELSEISIRPNLVLPLIVVSK